MDIVKGLRPLDYVLAALLVGLAAFVGFENVNAGAASDLAHPLDSQSALIVPVFALAALPILWRRRSTMAAIAASFVVTAASVPMFGWAVRCGWGLPLSFALAYALARFTRGRQDQLVGLVGILALQVVILIKDSATGGLGALYLAVPVAAVAYGIGGLVRFRTEKASADPTLAVENVHA